MKHSFSAVIAVVSAALFSSVVATSVKPPSDECRTATNIPITALPYSANVSIAAYTNNVADSTSCDISGRSMWWKFTPPSDGVLSVLTNDVRERFGPGLDLNIGTIAGRCANSAQMKCGEDFFSASSLAQPIVHAGVTYFIVVGEIEGSTGNAQFNFTVKFDPLNLNVSGDECTDAIVIPHTTLPFNQIVDTRAYTTNENDFDTSPGCAYAPEDNTIFFSYTPTMNGLMIIDTSGSISDAEGGQLDSTVTIFSGCNGTVLFCDEQDRTEITHYPVTAGVSYTIRVGGYKFFVAGGQLNFTLSFQRNYFNLVNEDEEETIGVLNDLYNGIYPGGSFPTNTINYASFPTTNLSIEAIFPKPNSIHSVRLSLDNQQSICQDDNEERKIYGERNNMNVPFAIGNRVISATAYSRSNCTGNVVGRASQEFLVLGCEYVQYSLYDAPRDIYVANLYNGTTIASPPCQVNIGVTFQCGFDPSKVRLELRRTSNNSLVVGRNDYSTPYSLFGDDRSSNFVSGKIQAGEYKLTAIINNIAHPSVRFTMGTCKAPPKVDTTFDIDLHLEDGTSFKQSKFFPKVVKRISSLIVGDRPDFINKINGTSVLGPDFFCGDFPSRIDDLHICAVFSDFGDENDVGGILGVVVTTHVRPSDNLPISAAVLFDEDDFSHLLNTGKVESYILQQLIQALGLGTYWEELGLRTSGSAPCTYNGTKAKAAFQAITGCSSDIPLEQNSVPDIDGYGELTADCMFWDPACLKNEVLTYTLGPKKISRITLGALEDLGYDVNYTAADPYGPNDIGTCTGCHNIRHRNLKGPQQQALSQSKPSTTTTSSCHSGIVHDRAVRHGRQMLREIHDHHIEQSPNQPPILEGIVFTGHRRVTVMYQEEDGILCSVVVTPTDFF